MPKTSNSGVTGLNHGWQTGYNDWGYSWFSWMPAVKCCIVTRLGQGSLLPNRFHFISYPAIRCCIFWYRNNIVKYATYQQMLHPSQGFAASRACVAMLNVNVSLCFYHQVMKTYEVEVYLHAFLILVLDAHEWTASSTGRFTNRQSSYNSHSVAGWVGKEKKFFPAWNQTHVPRSSSSKLDRYNGWTILNLFWRITSINELIYYCYYYYYYI
jgi:hypothetical protein